MIKIIADKLPNEKILSLLLRVDEYFTPSPLSEKINLLSYSEKLANYAEHFYAVDANKLIGMCCCYINDPQRERVFITITCIDPEYIGRGIGKDLTFACENHARNEGFKFIEFEVHVENLRSIGMHKKIGYFIDRQEGNSFYMKKYL